jgi:hypothetical protein
MIPTLIVAVLLIGYACELRGKKQGYYDGRLASAEEINQLCREINRLREKDYTNQYINLIGGREYEQGVGRGETDRGA